MGILNLTPDSFADGGRFVDPAAALAHAERMIAQGADIIDIGAESTRPYRGMRPVSADEELTRLMPVLPQVIALGVPVSIDTIKAEIATRALAVGAVIVNDVWGLQRDPEMAPVIAAHDVPVVVTHNRETVDPALDILADMEAFFSRSLEIAWSAGIARDRIVLDPGIGFGKTPPQSLAALAGIPRLRDFGLPLLIGLSRKRFINAVSPSAPQDRLGGSLAGAVLSVLEGAAIVRVHDVAETVQALRVAAAIRAAR
ncbi:MAG: dihydropteroate synthase [Hyphomicrobiales bacterium]|nr:dihydropteroate synthase [Hyphomicrobiales bacterium]MBV9426763.1 dihydropteroate synthase [Bradyrhizobiaceae bacterium]